MLISNLQLLGLFPQAIRIMKLRYQTFILMDEFTISTHLQNFPEEISMAQATCLTRYFFITDSLFTEPLLEIGKIQAKKHLMVAFGLILITLLCLICQFVSTASAQYGFKLQISFFRTRRFERKLRNQDQNGLLLKVACFKLGSIL